MPRAKTPLKRDLLRTELAERLGLPLTDIMDRKEAGRFLDRHEKTFSNDAATAPFFYKADFGRNGLTLYTRDDLRLWRDDEPAFGRLRKEMGTNQRPWPHSSGTARTAPIKSDTEVLLDNLKVADDYKAQVLGRRPSS